MASLDARGFTMDPAEKREAAGEYKWRNDIALNDRSEGRVTDRTAWGGYNGVNVIGPDGKVQLDRSQSGQARDVDRYRSLASTAANHEAFQNDYSRANEYRDMGVSDRALQARGLGYMSEAASGRTPSRAEMLGQRMLQQGVAAQQSAAISARGGSLAQAAAIRQQQLGQNAFVQQGQSQIAAARAVELQAAREQYAQAAQQVGAADLQGQSLAQKQAEAQMQNEMQQRALNQQGELAYEGLGYDTNAAALQGNLQSQQTGMGIYQNQLAIDQSQRERETRLLGAGAAAGGALLSSLARSNDDYTRSDIRSKQRVMPLSSVAARGR